MAGRSYSGPPVKSEPRRSSGVHRRLVQAPEQHLVEEVLFQQAALRENIATDIFHLARHA
ncbi:hypothetical protein SBBP2_630008 [Burkholderiales bacterium]|nr:hypothetical protein SBBP2_630008 [Burkholderiales bacterium]